MPEQLTLWRIEFVGRPMIREFGIAVGVPPLVLTTISGVSEAIPGFVLPTATQMPLVTVPVQLDPLSTVVVG